MQSHQYQCIYRSTHRYCSFVKENTKLLPRYCHVLGCKQLLFNSAALRQTKMSKNSTFIIVFVILQTPWCLPYTSNQEILNDWFSVLIFKDTATYFLLHTNIKGKYVCLPYLLGWHVTVGAHDSLWGVFYFSGIAGCNSPRGGLLVLMVRFNAILWNPFSSTGDETFSLFQRPD